MVNESFFLHFRPVVPKDCALLFNLVDLMERVRACMQYENDVCNHACCIQTTQENLKSTRSSDSYACISQVLTKARTELFGRWAPAFVKQMISLSHTYPHVSEFYRLLTMAMKICTSSNYFQVGLACVFIGTL